MNSKGKRLVLQDIVIESRAKDNFINASQLCKAGGKQFKHWFGLESTKELIKALEEDLKSEVGIPTSLIDVRKGNSKHFTQGSWVHPDLAVQLAQWISPQFAIQVSRWVRELFVVGTVSVDSHKTDGDIHALQRELEQLRSRLDKEQKDKEERLERLLSVNAELVSYKQFKERNETLYIATTRTYAQQGLFKVGRTKNPKKRASSHNTTRPVGDKFKIVHEFKVNCAATVERLVHKKLDGLRPSRDSEFFLCPFDSLVDIIDLMVECDREANEQVNKLVMFVYQLKQERLQHCDWTSGLDMNVFTETVAAVDGEQTVASFDLTHATPEQKQAFVRQCLDAYKLTIEVPHQAVATIVWKAFQGFLIQELGIPKSRFRAKEWRPLVENVEKQSKHLAITWRQ